MGESTATPESTAAYRGAARGFREARQGLLESYREGLDKSLPALPYWRERLNSRWETVEPAEVREAMRRLFISMLVGVIQNHLREHMGELYALSPCFEAERPFDVSVQIPLPHIPSDRVSGFWQGADLDFNGIIWTKEGEQRYVWLKEGLRECVNERYIPPFTDVEIGVSGQVTNFVATVKISFDSALHWPVVSST